MNKLREIPAQWLAIILIICLSFIFYSPVLLSPNVFFAGDNLSINMPSKVLFFRMLTRGQLPLWNPYTFSGSPFLADINLGLLSPLNIFYLIFLPLRALTFSIITATTIAGVGTYYYARRINVGQWGSLVASCIFMFSGSLATHSLNTAVLNTVIWIPLVFYLLESLFQKQRVIYCLLTSIILSFSLFGGHIQFFYYILLFSLAYILAQPFAWKRKLTYAAFIYIPALFLTAVQWVPFLQYASYSTRPVQSLSYAGNVPLVSFIHLLVPNFFGIAKDGTSWGAIADTNGYVGIIPLLLVALLAFRQKSRLIWFFILTIFISLLLSLGSHSPLYLLAFYVLPLFSRFRSPAEILVIYSFAVAVLAGISLDKPVKVKYPLLILSAAVILLILTLLLGGNAQGFILHIMSKLNGLRKTAFLTRFLEYSAVRDQIIFSLWFENLAIILFSVFSFALASYVNRRRLISEKVFQFLLFFLVASDLFFFAGNNMIVTNGHKLQTPPAIISTLRKDASHFRILTYPDPGAKPPFADPSYFEKEAQKSFDILLPNINILSGIESVGGYASIVRRDYASYLSPIKTVDPTGISLPLPGSRQIDELNVKYILTAGDQISTLSAVSYYKPVVVYHDIRINRSISVFENTHELPRTYAVDAHNRTTGSVSITNMTPDNIHISVQLPAAARLVLSEIAYPGWLVAVDGNPAKIETYRGIFRSVALPGGKHEVVFKYSPFLLYAAGLLSLVNWVYELGFLVFLMGKKQEQVGEKLHVSEPEVKKDA